MKKLIEQLNALNLTQNSYKWLEDEDIPQDIYDAFLKDMKEVDSQLDIDKHRWYETSVSVYQIGDKFLGVESVTDLFSEQMDYSDCRHTLNFFEMEEYSTVSYRVKK